MTFKLLNPLKITLREEILNLYDHYNVLGYTWLGGLMVEHGLSGRIYNIGLRVEF